MDRKVGIIGGLAAAVAVATIGAIAVTSDDEPGPSAAAIVEPAFSAGFSSPDDFYNRFDFGYSGLFIPGVSISSYHGDHAVAPAPNCGGPTTDRTVALNATTKFDLDYSEAFWWCAPSGDASSGHMMTGITTTGYNHAWFAPKPAFTAITKVCWDINETTEYGKWTEVQFVGNADATRYPTGTHTANDNSIAGALVGSISATPTPSSVTRPARRTVCFLRAERSPG